MARHVYADIDAQLVKEADSVNTRRSLVKPLVNWRSPVGIHMVAMSCVFAYACVFIGTMFLPSKYLRDSAAIKVFMQYTPTVFQDTPFGRTAALYNKFAFLGGEDVMGFLAITMFTVLVWKCWPKGEPKLWHAVILAGSFVLAGVYLAVYSKDLFVVPLVLVFVLLRPSFKWELLWVAGVLGYATVLRANWLAVAAVYVTVRVIFYYSRNLRSAFLWTTAMMAALAVGFNIVLGQTLHYHRYDVSEGLSVDINTRIIDPIADTGMVGSFLNGLYSLIVFLFPVQLASMGNPLYILAAVFIGVNWWLVFRKLGPLLRREAPEQTVMFWRAIALLLSYTLVQSLYAPDWGAYVRHMTPLFPLFAIVLGDTSPSAFVIKEPKQRKRKLARPKRQRPSQLTRNYLRRLARLPDQRGNLCGKEAGNS